MPAFLKTLFESLLTTEMSWPLTNIPCTVKMLPNFLLKHLKNVEILQLDMTSSNKLKYQTAFRETLQLIQTLPEIPQRKKRNAIRFASMFWTWRAISILKIRLVLKVPAIVKNTRIRNLLENKYNIERLNRLFILCMNPYAKYWKKITISIDDLWQEDLLDLSSIAQHDDGYNFSLAVIDVFSEVACVVPLKNKSD